MAQKYIQVRIPDGMKQTAEEFEKMTRDRGENPSIVIRRFIRAYVKGEFDSSSFFWKTNNDDVSPSQI